MVLFTHVIEDVEGLHARPAVKIVTELQCWLSTVTVSCGTSGASATDLMGLMGLDARQGDELIVTVEGPDEEAAAMALQRVFTF